LVYFCPHLGDNGSGAGELEGRQIFWVHILNSFNHAAGVSTDIKLFLISEKPEQLFGVAAPYLRFPTYLE